MSSQIFFAKEEDTALRLDIFLSGELDASRSQIAKLIENEKVLVNDEIKLCGYKVKASDKIIVELEAKPTSLEEQDLPLDIIFEDNDIAVINKKRGMQVHPGGGVVTGTLANALIYRYKESMSFLLGSDRPGIVHRLDKDTSGVMVVAKNDNAQLLLSEQFSLRQVEKRYVAILEGVLKEDSGEVKTFISRDSRNRKLMAVVQKNGKEAISRFKVLERYAKHSLVQFSILTGRTHQIRVHAKFMGHPVVGDIHYGFRKQRFNLQGQLLHSEYICFTHPKTKKSVSFSASLPEDFVRIKKILEREKNDD